jgi:hypothetical protein
MYELLLSTEEKSKYLSPFASLFNKQVGNIYDRFKLTESICTRLMSNFKSLAEKCECSKFFFSLI